MLHPSIEEIKKGIIHYNSAQTVLNEEKFGPLQDDTIVMVIQVILCVCHFRICIIFVLKKKNSQEALNNIMSVI